MAIVRGECSETQHANTTTFFGFASSRPSKAGTAVVVQGGGTRGAFSAGALAALADSELADDVAVVLGTSSGALAGSLFVARRSDLGRTYLGQGWSLAELGTRSPRSLVDPYRLVDHLLASAGLKPDDLASARPELVVGLAEASTLLPRYVSLRDKPSDQVRSILSAAIANPVLVRRSVELDGQRYLDGGFVDPLPAVRPLLAGYRRVVVIMTWPLEHAYVDDSRLQRTGLRMAAIGHGRRVAKWIGQPNPLHDLNIEFLVDGSSLGTLEKTLIVAPTSGLPWMSWRSSELVGLFDHGYTAAKQVLAASSPS